MKGLQESAKPSFGPPQKKLIPSKPDESSRRENNQICRCLKENLVEGLMRFKQELCVKQSRNENETDAGTKTQNHDRAIEKSSHVNPSKSQKASLNIAQIHHCMQVPPSHQHSRLQVHLNKITPPMSPIQPVQPQASGNTYAPPIYPPTGCKP